MNSQRAKNHPLPKTMLVVVALILAFARAAGAQENGHVCIPQLGTDPALSNVFPVIDGTVEGYPDTATPSGLKTDPGWNQAAKINLVTSGTTRTAKLLLGKSATDVYIGLEIESPVVPAINDTVVLGLATDNVAANDWRIIIFPFMSTSGSIFENSQPGSVSFQRGSQTWNGTSAGDWLDPSSNNIKVSRYNSTWYMEIKIPRGSMPTSNASIAFPSGTNDPADNFRLYINVLNTSDVTITMPLFLQEHWPTWTGAEIPGVAFGSGSANLENNIPAKDNGTTPQWGTASLFPRTDCTGISLTWDQVGTAADTGNPTTSAIGSNIRAIMSPMPAFPTLATCADSSYSNNTNPSQIGPQNILVARPVNNMPMHTPTDMTVTFRLADWGIPGVIPAPNDPRMGDWQPITGRTGLFGPNPAIGPNMPPAGGATTGHFLLPWQLTYKESCIFVQAHGAHECMLVDMDSTDPGVRFLNRSVARNMDFVQTSRFSRDAKISAHGYGDPPMGRTNQQFLIWVDKHIENFRGGNPKPILTAPAAGRVSNLPDVLHQPRLASEEIRNLAPSQFPQGLSEAFVWVARGYRMTGRFIQIRDRRYEYAESVGGFGYVAGHNGEVKRWEQSFTGNGLTQLSGDVYTLAIPPEGVATVNTVIEAVEPQSTSGFRRWGLSLHAGISIPHGNFDTFYNPGPNFAVDLEYRLKPTFSLELIYGFHRFRGQRFDLFKVPDLNLHQLSFNGKFYGSSSPLRPFFNFGGGVYHFDPSSTHGGLNIGVGVQRDITPNFAIEAMYNFHNVFTSGSNTRFSTVQGGVRFRF